MKHFKFEERGKRRIHAKPRGAEIAACRPWLEAEIDAVRPRLLVALGATAAQALTGKALPITANRGKFLQHPRAETMLVTMILRSCCVFRWSSARASWLTSWPT
ncbi:MAG: hypothetical protein K2X35_16645 [Bryobacteraceae bacterium]|nr:hypothetical protein [Bryobacteraceae bacterium]